MSVATQQKLVERIWARDATVWTGADEGKWLGWLDEPQHTTAGGRLAASGAAGQQRVLGQAPDRQGDEPVRPGDLADPLDDVLRGDRVDLSASRGVLRHAGG